MVIELSPETAVDRMCLYNALSLCFDKPWEVFWYDPQSTIAIDAAMKRICPELLSLAKKVFSRETNDMTDRHIEYARLFVGPFSLIAPPFGSVYLEKRNLVMGDTTTAVMSYYLEMGLKMDPDFRNPPDHITSELEFMAYLIFLEAQAVKTHDPKRSQGFQDKQREFVASFLWPFVMPFCERITSGTSLAYFRDLAELLVSYIDLDRHYLWHQTAQHQSSIKQ